VLTYFISGNLLLSYVTSYDANSRIAATAYDASSIERVK
jgi:hypothetical protein